MKLDDFKQQIPTPVEFNPEDKDHLMSYYLLKYKGKQTTRRFNLPRPFNSVLAVMEHRIGQKALQDSIVGESLNFNYSIQF